MAPIGRAAIAPSRHGCDEVRTVLEHLVALGWSLTAGGHWGMLWCPCGSHQPISVPGNLFLI
jgi:hypothetical protein